MVERLLRQIKDARLACGAGPAQHSNLPWVLMGLNTVPKKDSAVSSAELVTGSTLILTGQLLHFPDPPRVIMPPPQTQPTSYALPAHLAKAENMCTYVQQKPLQFICE